jgi:hypothetical protein
MRLKELVKSIAEHNRRIHGEASSGSGSPGSRTAAK